MGFFDNLLGRKPPAPKTTVENSNVENKEKDKEIIEKKKTFLDHISKYSNRTFLGLSLLTAPFLMSKDGIGGTFKSKEKFKKGQTEHVIDQSKTINVNAFERTHVKDAAGVVNFNEYSFIAPVSLEGVIETNTIDSSNTTISYKYARNLKDVAAESPELLDSLKKDAKADFKKQVTKALTFYSVGSTNTTQEVDAYKKGGMREEGSVTTPEKITSLEITGWSSPEGRTVQSLDPTFADPENVNLGLLRAEDAVPIVKEALAESGRDTSSIDIKVKGAKTHFSQEENEKLVEFAAAEGFMTGTDTIGNVNEFIKSANKGTIKDPKIAAQMKKMLGDKRFITIQKTTEGKEKKDVVFPLPLLLLLLPSLYRGIKGFNWDKFKKRKENKEDPLPPPIVRKEPRQIFSEATLEQSSLDKDDKNFHDLYRNAAELSDAKGKDVSRISDLVYSEEIYPYINDADTIEKGLDYKWLVDTSRHLRDLKPPHYRNDAEIKEKIAEMVLEDWQEYDRNVRNGITTSAGPDRRDLTAEEIKRTVEYRHDPSKVLWAIQAADHIFELSNAKNDEALEKLMDERLASIEAKRAVEVAGIPAEKGKTVAQLEKDLEEEPVTVTASTIATPIDEPKALPVSPIAVEPVAPIATAAPVAAVEPVVAEKKPRAPRKKVEQVTEPVDAPIPLGNLEPVNGYDQYKADQEKLGDMMGGFAQALSQENLQKMYAEQQAEKEAKKQETAPQDRINVIDAQLQALEFQLNDKKLRKDEKAPIEAKFNELEQEKRAIEKTL